MNFKISRRQILTGAALAAATGAAAGWGNRYGSALASITVGPHTEKTGGDTLVVMFLRGGADGLNILVPYGDDHYYKHRPLLGIAAPNDRKTDVKLRAVMLDDFFGLHPSLAPLQFLRDSGQLAAVHAIGSQDQSRSHFEAMEAMERGLADSTGSLSNGWLARHLASTCSEVESPLRAVAIGETMPDSLRGAVSATSLVNLTDFRLTHPYNLPTGNGGKPFHTNENAESRAAAFEATLKQMYGDEPGSTSTKSAKDYMKSGGKEALAAMDSIKRLDPANYKPAFGAVYPEGEVGSAFRQVAALIKGEVGLEIACLDMGGWDTHVAQGNSIGWQALRLAELGQGLAAFAKDLGTQINRVTTIVMTEFGRRVYENSGLGTDHGRGSCMLLMGGGVVPGKVHGVWPGLKPEQLDGPGDLKVTTDYRDVFAEVLSRRLKNDKLDQVFPQYTPKFHNVVKKV